MSELTWLGILLISTHANTLVGLCGRVFARAPQNPWNSAGRIFWGKYEYGFGPLRDQLLMPIMILIVTAQYFRGARGLLSRDLLFLTLILSWGGLTRLSLKNRRKARLQLVNVAISHSHVHPRDFFDFYYAHLSPWPPRNQEIHLSPLNFEAIDFRSGQKSKRTLSPVLPSAISTNSLARLAVFAFKNLGPESGRDAFDSLARIWSTRIAWHFRMRLNTTGIANIPPLEGKTLLLFNHNSYLDFILNFWVMGNFHYQNGRPLRPRFIAAKDHFVDNKIIYSWLSVGKVMENAGMIFINRREKGKGWEAMAQAADRLVHSELEIAVYPQGTRATPLKNLEGGWQDSGFYTSAPAKKWNDELGHLKPGTAHLILDAIRQLKELGETKLNVLVAGIHGVGEVAPKGSSKVFTEKTVTFNLATLWEISTDSEKSLEEALSLSQKSPEEKIHALQRQIHEKLLEALDWHPQLMREFETRMSSLSIAPPIVQAWLTQFRLWDGQKKIRPFILLERTFCLGEAQQEILEKLASIPPESLENDRQLFLEVAEKFYQQTLREQ